VKWRSQQGTLVLDLDNGCRLMARPGDATCTVSLWDTERQMLACCQLPRTREQLEAVDPRHVLAASLQLVLRGEYGVVPQYGEYALQARRSWGRDACEALRQSE
jgi:hypothetical protein